MSHGDLSSPVAAVLGDRAHSQGEERLKAIGGIDAGRHLLIVFALRQREHVTFIRPISARYLRASEGDHKR